VGEKDYIALGEISRRMRDSKLCAT